MRNASQVADLIEPYSKRQQNREIETLDGPMTVALDEIVERLLPAERAQRYFLGESAVVTRKVGLRKCWDKNGSVRAFGFNAGSIRTPPASRTD